MKTFKQILNERDVTVGLANVGSKGEVSDLAGMISDMENLSRKERLAVSKFFKNLLKGSATISTKDAGIVSDAMGQYIDMFDMVGDVDAAENIQNEIENQ